MENKTTTYVKYLTLNGSGENRAKVSLDYHNKRLKVIDYKGTTPHLLKEKINEAAYKEGLTKILWLLRPEDAPPLLEEGYIIEGRFPDYFRGKPALWLSYFLDFGRRSSPNLAEEEAIIWKIEKNGNPKEIPELPPHLQLKKVTPDKAQDLADLFAEIFKTYPTPVTDVEYLRKTMAEDTIYIAIYDDDKMVSIASGIIDKKNMAAEISDYATRLEYRCKKLMSIIISALEAELTKMGIKSLYSLARAMSPGMNRSLYKAGYKFRGRFINNCNICGRFEDMNLWTKS